MARDVAARLRERIAEARQSAGLTQVALERRLELPAGAFSKIESGAREISSMELAELASLCGKSVAWFFSEMPKAVVHFRGEIGDEESRRDLAWFSEFVTAYRGLQKRLGRA
jgi:transcriptional regulator with XRE-family HTH domain